MVLNGRKKFTPNEIGEFRFGEGSELTDRTGLRFRTRYRDVLETLLSFGGGDILAVDNHQNQIKDATRTSSGCTSSGAGSTASCTSGPLRSTMMT